MAYTPVDRNGNSNDVKAQWQRDTAAFLDVLAAGAQTETVNTPAVESGSTALSSNAARTGWQIQNVGTNPLYVLLGTGASSSVFHFVLKGGSADSDGNGASFSQLSGPIYLGNVTIAGTNPGYVILELS